MPMRRYDDIRLGIVAAGQRGYIALHPIDNPQVINLSEPKRPHGTRLNTKRIKTLSHPRTTTIALAHSMQNSTETGRLIRTRKRTASAPDASIAIEYHKSIRLFTHGTRRTHLLTYGVFTVVARHRKIVPKHIMPPGITICYPRSTRCFAHPTKRRSVAKLIGIATRHLAGFTSRTARRIDMESILFHHHCCPAFAI